MPRGFARPAGWGDIIVAVLALAVLGAIRTQSAKKLLLVWNTLGLIDIVFVVFSALRFGLNDWQAMHPLRELPLSAANVSGADDYRVTCFDFREAGKATTAVVAAVSAAKR